MGRKLSAGVPGWRLNGTQSAPPCLPLSDVRTEPIFVDFEAETRTFGHGKDALADRRLAAPRHLFLISAERAENIFHFEELFYGRAEVHGGVPADERARAAVHSHGSAGQGGVI